MGGCLNFYFPPSGLKQEEAYKWWLVTGSPSELCDNVTRPRPGPTELGTCHLRCSLPSVKRFWSSCSILPSSKPTEAAWGVQWEQNIPGVADLVSLSIGQDLPFFQTPGSDLFQAWTNTRDLGGADEFSPPNRMTKSYHSYFHGILFCSPKE